MAGPVAKRIPPRGTPEWKQYWAVRYFIDGKKFAHKQDLKWINSMPDSERKTLFLEALSLQEQALKLFEEAHAIPYL